MVPADSDDIHNEYKVLLHELAEYNPELLDKQRILAISKSDMLDEELMAEIRLDLPEIPVVFISSVVGTGLTELKDRLWEVLNDASNQPTAITHRDMIIPVRTIPEHELIDDEDLMPKTEEYMDEEEVVDPF